MKIYYNEIKCESDSTLSTRSFSTPFLDETQWTAVKMVLGSIPPQITPSNLLSPARLSITH